MSVTLHLGCCLSVMRALAPNSVDAVVTDPPYELGFMGKSWDASGIAFNPDVWREALRVLKPGGHLLAFSGSRTYHRMAVAIEDAGFEVRDQIMWLYGSGFPKSLAVDKAIDKAAGAEREVVGTRRAGITPRGNLCNHGVAEADKMRPVTAPATPAARQWEGWGTALKPAHEPIVVARKPLTGTVAANVLEWGTGALNIDGCRVGSEGATKRSHQAAYPTREDGGEDRSQHWARTGHRVEALPLGRWPANVIHDGGDEVMEAFAAFGEKGGGLGVRGGRGSTEGYRMHHDTGQAVGFGDTGTAARFFYAAKASKADRDAGLEGMPLIEGRPLGISNWKGQTNGSGETMGPSAPRANIHPTVKPTSLMQYLCRLITPPGGTVLDPFMGSGSTGRGAVLEGFSFVGIEREAEYIDIARRRIADAERVATPQPEPASDQLALAV